MRVKKFFHVGLEDILTGRRSSRKLMQSTNSLDIQKGTTVADISSDVPSCGSAIMKELHIVIFNHQLRHTAKNRNVMESSN